MAKHFRVAGLSGCLGEMEGSTQGAGRVGESPAGDYAGHIGRRSTSSSMRITFSTLLDGRKKQLMGDRDGIEKAKREIMTDLLAYLDIDLYLNKRGASTYLSMSVSSIEKRLIEIPHFRVGQKVLFRKSELDHWIEQYRETSEELDLAKLADDAMEALGK